MGSGADHMNDEVDMVNHPPHYNQTKYEVIDVLQEFFPDDPLLWQVGKYLLRAKFKGAEKQDLQKAIWYLEQKTKGL